MPRRSASAVATMSTRESRSSIQSTGISWMRSPARSASTSSSVSKNQPVSLVSGSRTRAGSRRIALKPHCASENRAPIRRAQQQVVTARDELPLGPADDPGTAGQPGADGQVAVPGQQRGDEREQGVQVCRQIDIHIGEDLGLVLRPDGAQRPAAPGQRQVDGPDLGQFAGQPVRDGPGGIGAAVVGDRDPGGEREALAQEADQPPDARREITLLIANRHHYVNLENSHSSEDGRPRSVAAEATLWTRYEPISLRP